MHPHLAVVYAQDSHCCSRRNQGPQSFRNSLFLRFIALQPLAGFRLFAEHPCDSLQALEQGAQQLLESDLPFELLQLIFARPAPQQSLTIDEYAMSRLHPENAIEREAKRFLLLISFAGIGGDCPK